MKTMPHYKLFSNSHRSFFSINFLYLTTLVGYTLIYSLCYLGIIASLGFAALLPVRKEAELLPSNFVKYNGVKSSQNIYCNLKFSPQVHLLRHIALHGCSCKYNQVPTTDLKLTEEEKGLIVPINHRIMNHHCGRQSKKEIWNARSYWESLYLLVNTEKY